MRQNSFSIKATCACNFSKSRTLSHVFPMSFGKIFRAAFLQTEAAVCRSSCLFKIGVLKNFTKFTGKHLCQSLFFNKMKDSGLQLY